MGKPTPEQLARINQLARTPLAEDDVYTFPAKLVGDNVIPMRYQRVTPNFLQKMSQQAKDGVSLLLDHSWANIGTVTVPLGRTFDSKLQQDGDELALYADHYMLRGQTIQNTSTDALASGIDGGTIFDTSVGFIGTKHVCSICKLDYYGGDCSHFRGNEYEGKMCIVEIDDGQLMENSLVFDGAYPGAGIVGMSNTDSPSAQQPNEYTVLSDTTKSLPGDGRVFYSFSNKSGIVGYIRQSQTVQEGVDPVNELEQVKAQLSTVQSVLGKVRELLGVASDDAVESTISALKVNAQLGEQYKAKVIEEACGAGVRALGEAFNVESMKLAFSNLPVGEVEKIRETYEKQAQVALGGGGQHVVTQGAELPGNPAENPQAPREGFKSTDEARDAARNALKRHGHSDLLKEAN